MTDTVRLDFAWWQKHTPEWLRKGAVETALRDFSECNAALPRSGDAKSFFKSVTTLKSAIAKDQQLARRADDPYAVTLLTKIEKLADQQTRATEEHLTIAFDDVQGLSTAGRDEGSHAARQEPAAIQVVNRLATSWPVVRNNQLDASAHEHSCQAVPEGLSEADELSAWQVTRAGWLYVVTNRLQQAAVEVNFQLQFQWNGQSPREPGLFVNDCRIWAEEARTLWGFTINVDTSTPDPPYNSGSNTGPVGAIGLLVTVRVETPLNSLTRNWTVTCHGNGQRDVR